MMQERGRGESRRSFSLVAHQPYFRQVSIASASRAPTIPSSPPARPAACHRRRRGLIAWDDADVMVAGGAEAAICRVGVGGFAACRALSTGYKRRLKKLRVFRQGPRRICHRRRRRRRRAGRIRTREKRGARIYAEVIGYGMSGDAYHVTSPAEDGDGGFRAMKAALKRANVSPTRSNTSTRTARRRRSATI